jgi:hypothetical protein
MGSLAESIPPLVKKAGSIMAAQLVKPVTRSMYFRQRVRLAIRTTIPAMEVEAVEKAAEAEIKPR